MKIQKAVKDETVRVAIGELIGVAAMIAVWLILHLCAPSVPLNWLIVILAMVGGAVAVINFLLLGLFVQKATGIDDDETVKQYYKSTFRRRRLIQFLWGILSFVLPIFLGFSVINGIAGVIPLLFPTFTIRIVGMKDAVRGMAKQEASDDEADADNDEDRKEMM